LSATDRTAIEASFPRLTEFEYRLTSPRDPRYNCFAWAGRDSTRVWSPVLLGSGVYWPPGIPALPSIGGVLGAYGVLGYQQCDSSDLEPGYEKIAIYVDQSQEPRHAARQLPSGEWASKLGEHVDIVHSDLDAVSGLMYGEATVFMRRWTNEGEAEPDQSKLPPRTKRPRTRVIPRPTTKQPPTPWTRMPRLLRQTNLPRSPSPRPNADSDEVEPPPTGPTNWSANARRRPGSL